MKKTLEMSPRFTLARAVLIDSYILQGMFDNAMDVCRQGLNDFPASPIFLNALAEIYGGSGRMDESRQILNQLFDAEKRGVYVPAGGIALIYTAPGEKEKAINYLEKAYATHEISAFVFLKVWPQFDSLRSDPRFDALPEKMGLAD